VSSEGVVCAEGGADEAVQCSTIGRRPRLKLLQGVSWCAAATWLLASVGA